MGAAVSLPLLIAIGIWAVLVAIVVFLFLRAPEDPDDYLSQRQIENLRPRGNVDRTPREER
jgi:hypothetical protein